MFERFDHEYGHVEQIVDEWKNEEGKFIGYKCKFKGDPLIYDVKKRHLKAPQLLS